MKCPFQVITTERTLPGTGALKETKTVFGECVQDDCPYYRRLCCVCEPEKYVESCRRTK